MIHISKNKCVGCGSCVTECPQNCISINDSVACIEQQNCINCKSCIDVCSQSAIMEILEKLMLAIGTDDGKNIKSDDHVGMSRYFQVWSFEDGELTFNETRENAKYREDETMVHGDPGKAKATASALNNVDVLIGEMFGPNISRLRNKFVCAVVRGRRTIEQGIDMIKANINEIVEEKNKTEKSGIILTL